MSLQIAPDPASPWPRPSSARAIRLAAGLSLFCEASEDADEAGRDLWEFAVTAQELFSVGLRGTDLRWLAAHGLVAHAVEQLRRRKGRRCFGPAPDLAITEHSCFILTVPGRRFAEESLVGETDKTRPSDPTARTEARPRWDASSRELRWQDRLVKQFRTPARSQELILAVFEEEGWASRIDDPLDGRAGRDPHQRLHDAVRRLNGNQREARIRFSRDGTGRGICWRPEPAPTPLPRPRRGSWGTGAAG